MFSINLQSHKVICSRKHRKKHLENYIPENEQTNPLKREPLHQNRHLLKAIPFEQTYSCEKKLPKWISSNGGAHFLCAWCSTLLLICSLGKTVVQKAHECSSRCAQPSYCYISCPQLQLHYLA